MAKYKLTKSGLPVLSYNKRPNRSRAYGYAPIWTDEYKTHDRCPNCDIRGALDLIGQVRLSRHGAGLAMHCETCKGMGYLPTPGAPKTRREEYNEYLLSPDWKRLRRLVLHRDEYTCSVNGCAEQGGLEVHHMAYPRVLGYEDPATLVTLCVRHHQQVHYLQRQGALLWSATEWVLSGKGIASVASEEVEDHVTAEKRPPAEGEEGSSSRVGAALP